MKMHCVLFILKKGLQSVQKVCIIIFVVEREISQSTKHNGRLAQLGEHLPYKQGVTGSIWLGRSPVTRKITGSNPVVTVKWLGSSVGRAYD